MNHDRLAALLQRVQGGHVSVPQAIRQLRTLPFEDLGFASVDHHRSLRQGFPEVILCEGKTPAQITAIARKLLKAGGPFLATRVSPANARSLKRLARKAVYHEMARMVSISDSKRDKQGLILIVTAGTSDIPVAEEAKVTAEVMGSRVHTLYDVGVAGLHRLLDRQESPSPGTGRRRRRRNGWGIAQRGGRVGRSPDCRRAHQPGLRGEFWRARPSLNDAECLLIRNRRGEYR